LGETGDVLILWLASAITAGAPAVQWSAPPECPDAATAHEAIASGLAPDSDLQVRASVSAGADRFIGEVEVRGPAGETRRTLESPECATLLDAVALIAQAAEAEGEQAAAAQAESAAVEADVVPAAEAPRPVSSRTAAPEPPPTVHEPPTTRAKRKPLAISPYLRATGRIGWGMSPLFDGGGGLAFGVQWKRLRVEAFGDVLAPGEKAVPGEEDARVRVFAWSVGVRGCGIAWAGASERIAIPVCGGAEAGQMIGRGVGPGLAGRDTFADAVVVLHAGPALLGRLSAWASVYAGLDAIVLAYRPGFAIRTGREADTIYRPAPAGVRLSLGIELHFPRRIRRPAGNQ
jgi:hypothetical protein